MVVQTFLQFVSQILAFGSAKSDTCSQHLTDYKFPRVSFLRSKILLKSVVPGPLELHVLKAGVMSFNSIIRYKCIIKYECI